MVRIIQTTSCRFLFAVLILAGSGFSKPASSLIEGRLSNASKVNGYYDIRLKIWDRHDQAKPCLIQTVEIPSVLVTDGHFRIYVNTGLESISDGDLEVKGESRKFESWKPFVPAEISSCRFGALEPGTESPSSPAVKPGLASTTP